MGVSHLGRGLHVLVRGVQPPVADIVRNGARKQVGVLDDHGERAAQVVLADVADVDAVVGDASAADLIEAVDQVDDRGLTGARGANEGDFLSRFGVEADVV